jgi:hypothetical protein
MIFQEVMTIILLRRKRRSSIQTLAVLAMKGGHSQTQQTTINKFTMTTMMTHSK